METATWQPLRAGGDGRDLVLAVDFGGARPEAGFVDLADRLPSDCTVLATRPPDGVVGHPADAARQVAAWRDAALATGAETATVIGYCSGAAVAAGLATELDGHGLRVGLVLVDPAVATPDLLVDVYRSSVESLVAVCDEPPADDDVADGPAPGADDLIDLARRLGDGYAGTAGHVGQVLDLDDELVQDLVVRFRRYLSYLVVAGLAERPERVGVPVLTVLSAAHPDDAFPLTGDRRVRFGVARADLLADAEVGQLLAGFVAAPDASPSSR